MHLENEQAGTTSDALVVPPPPPLPQSQEACSSLDDLWLSKWSGRPLSDGREGWLWLGDRSWVDNGEALSAHALTHRLQCTMTEEESQNWITSWGQCDCGLCPAIDNLGILASADDVGSNRDEMETHPQVSMASASEDPSPYSFRQYETMEGGKPMLIGCVPLFDDEPFCRHHAEPLLLAGSDFIMSARNNQGNIYVHCEKGCSRSPAVILCYLIRHEGLTLLEAVTLLKSKRVRISPNGALLDVLMRIDAKNCASPSDRTAVEAVLQWKWLPEYRAGRVKLRNVDAII